MGLLKRLPPLLTADLLHALRSMGHGDVLAIVDCNFPARAVAARTHYARPPIELAGADATAALRAVCSVLPLDMFVPVPVHYMDCDAGLVLPPLAAAARAEGLAAIAHFCPGVPHAPIARTAFYEAAARAMCVAARGDRSLGSLSRGLTRLTSTFLLLFCLFVCLSEFIPSRFDRWHVIRRVAVSSFDVRRRAGSWCRRTASGGRTRTSCCARASSAPTART